MGMRKSEFFHGWQGRSTDRGRFESSASVSLAGTASEILLRKKATARQAARVTFLGVNWRPLTSVALQSLERAGYGSIALLFW